MGNQGQLYFGLFLTSDTLLMAIYLLSGFLLLAIFVSMMRIFKKAGKPSVSAIVPVWGLLVLFQIVGVQWWYLFIPGINIIMAKIKLAKKFGKGPGFAIGMIFLPMIFIPLLSFYDFVGEIKEEKEEPIYNPFNQTNIAQVMPETPIAPVMPTNVEIPIDVTTPTDQVTPIEPAEIVEPINDNNIVENVISDNINEFNEPVIESPIVEVPEIQNVSEVKTNEPVNNLEPNEMVIPEIKEEIIDNVEVETELSEPLYQNIESQVSIPEVVQNPTVQDIRDALNINKEPVDVAFNSAPTIDVQSESIESIENLDVNEADIETSQKDVIEMPEIAAKVCPACGVSLAGDIKFCTSCGTQV